MIAIRGATTVTADTREEVEKATGALLSAIVRLNKLDRNSVAAIFFSTTKDITSAYPAAAARKVGFTDCALYSSLEPDIKGALKLCIRVMILSDIELCKDQIKHVYQRGARVLRPDLAPTAIAIDGPAGSGKSTAAKLLAARRGVLYLDTGAMYRACALAAVRAGIDPADESSVAGMLSSLELSVRYEDGEQRTFLGGEDVSAAIRAPEISMAASRISALRPVREKMVEMQREVAAENDCVLDGRDIGSFVLPDAKYKFFLTASVEVRAERRCEELRARGVEADIREVQSDIVKRDEQDRTRVFAPLVRAEDAVEIDTSSLSIEEVLAAIEQKIQEK